MFFDEIWSMDLLENGQSSMSIVWISSENIHSGSSQKWFAFFQNWPPAVHIDLTLYICWVFILHVYIHNLTTSINIFFPIFSALLLLWYTADNFSHSFRQFYNVLLIIGKWSISWEEENIWSWRRLRLFNLTNPLNLSMKTPSNVVLKIVLIKPPMNVDH